MISMMTSRSDYIDRLAREIARLALIAALDDIRRSTHYHEQHDALVLRFNQMMRPRNGQ